MNLRRRVFPPLPENLAGNVVGFSISEAEESVTDLKDLVAKLRKGTEEMNEKYGKIVLFDSNMAWQEMEEYRDDKLLHRQLCQHKLGQLSLL